MPTTREMLAAALLLRGDELVEGIIRRMQSEIPAYSRLDRDSLVPSATLTLQHLLHAIAGNRSLNPIELRSLTELGQLRGRQNVPLPDLFSAWRLAVRVTVDAFVTIGRAEGIGDRELLDLTTDVLDATDTAINTIVRGHHEAEHELTLQDERHRTEFVRSALTGTLTGPEIRINADRYGLDPHRTYHPVRIRPTTAAPTSRIERALSVIHRRGHTQGILAVIDSDIAGFFTQPPLVDLDIAIGFGPPADLQALEPSFRRATRAMVTAAAFGLTGTYDLAALGLLPAVLSDTEIGDELAARYIAPLGTGAGGQAILDTVRRYLVTEQRADRTAKVMQLHTNTIRYRLQRYQELTGTDLRDLNQCLELWWALQHHRLRHDGQELAESTRP